MEEVKFTLPQEDLDNPSYRKGYPGRFFTVYVRSWDKDAPYPHANFNPTLASYFKAGRYVGLRDELMTTLNKRKNENK